MRLRRVGNCGWGRILGLVDGVALGDDREHNRLRCGHLNLREPTANVLFVLNVHHPCVTRCHGEYKDRAIDVVGSEPSVERDRTGHVPNGEPHLLGRVALGTNDHRIDVHVIGGLVVR